MSCSVQHKGQVYIPLINYLLMTLCLIITGTFQSSANIGKAYGRVPACSNREDIHACLGRSYSLFRAPRHSFDD